MKYWGASARGLVRFICPCHGRGGGPGGSHGRGGSHRKILKSRVLEMLFLVFWGTEFYRIPKVVKYVEDMIFS